MIAAGLLGGLLLRAARVGERPPPLLFAFASLLSVSSSSTRRTSSSYSPGSPPACFSHGRLRAASGSHVWGASSPSQLRSHSSSTSGGSSRRPTLTGPVFSDQFSAPDVAVWSWTHARNTIPNILGLTSSWSLHGALPRRRAPRAGAILSSFSTRSWRGRRWGSGLSKGKQQRVALCLAGVGLAAILVSKGLHPPLVGLNLWLYNHVPGYWLLRDPAKVNLLIVLLFALLAALAVDRLEQSSPGRAPVVAGVLAAAALVYAHPLLTGAVVPDERRASVGARTGAARVERGRGVPRFRSRSGQGRRPPGGRLLPGADDLGLLRDVLPAPAPREARRRAASRRHYSDPVVAQHVASLEQQILDGGRNVSAAMQALGSKYLILRRDLRASFPGRSYVAPERLARALRHAPLASGGFARSVLSISMRPTRARPRRCTPPVPLLGAGAEPAVALPGRRDSARMSRPSPQAQATMLAGIAKGEPQAPLHEAGARWCDGDAHAVEYRRRRRAGPRPRRDALPEGLAAVSALFVGKQSFVVARHDVGASRSPLRRSPFRTPRSSASSPARNPFRSLIPPGLAERLGDCNRYDGRTPKRGRSHRRRSSDRTASRPLDWEPRDHSACVALPLVSSRGEDTASNPSSPIAA